MYDAALRDSQALIVAYAGQFTPQKQETVNRWVLQVTNKKALYQQKFDTISSASVRLDAPDLQELDRQYAEVTRSIGEARQYLLEGASFLIELKNALKFVD
jgi:hypothetical protein